jgi:hypothetical protein
MYMRIPETGKHNAALAGNRLDVLGDAQMVSDTRDDSVTDHDRYFPLRRRVWRGVDSGARYREILSSTDRTETEQE